MAFGDRTRILVGDDGAARLAAARVCVFGLGGVGAAAALDLVRAGVGALVVVDFDRVDESNLNRLAIGFSDTVGRPKVEAFADYARRVNPEVALELVGSIVRGDEAADMIPAGCGFYLDCIDTLNPKVNLIAALVARGFPFASSMGTAGRLAPERLRVGSLWDASGCPLARLVKKRLKRRGCEGAAITCVWSDEPAVPPVMPADGSIPGDTINGARVRAVQGSGPFVPQAAGHLLASLAVRSLLGVR